MCENSRIFAKDFAAGNIEKAVSAALNGDFAAGIYFASYTIEIFLET